MATMQVWPRRESAGCAIAVALSLLLLLSSAIVGAQSGKRDRKGNRPPKSSKSASVPHRGVLVFPTDSRSASAVPLADVVTEVVKSRFSASDRYDAISYSSAQPSVRRALNEHTLSQKDASPPYDDVAKVQKLAEYSGYDMVVTSSIDDYEYDAATHKATISLGILIIDFSAKPAVKRSFADTVMPAMKSADDIEAATKATRELAERGMTQLLEPAKPAAPPTAKNGSGTQ